MYLSEETAKTMDKMGITFKMQSLLPICREHEEFVIFSLMVVKQKIICGSKILNFADHTDLLLFRLLPRNHLSLCGTWFTEASSLLDS